MAQALDVIADVVTGERARAVDSEAPRRAIPWHLLRYQHTQAVRAVVAKRYAPATANRMLSALRGVLRESWRLGYLTAEDYHRAIDVRRVKGDRLPKGRALSAGEVRALFQAIAEQPHAATRARDAALLAVMYGGGPRRAEVTALEALLGWLEVRGTKAGPLFVPVDKAGRLEIRRLTTQAIFDRCAYLAEQAGIAPFSPHDLRRTFIGDLLDAGADL